MRIVSWNVNGSRARLKAGMEETITVLKPDILCLQETRAKPEQLPHSFISKYNSYFSLHNKAGYAGATTFMINPDIPLPFLHVDDFPDNDEPGRVSICDFKEFKLINAYVPNSGQHLEKIDHRVEWQKKLRKYIADQVKPVIFCGDINCAPAQIDTGCPSVKSGCSFQERNAYKDIIGLGMIDVFRGLYPARTEYTWYSNFSKGNKLRGMRIDAFIISKELMPLVTSIQQIQDDTLICGSDHVPLVLDINI